MMSELFDKAGNKIIIKVDRKPGLIPMTELFKIMCDKLREEKK